MNNSYKVYASQEYVDNKIQEIDTSVDWNAKEGEPGYVENRTHYEEGIGVFELDASCLEGAKDLLTTTSTSSLGTDSYIKITDKIITLEECEAAKIILVKPSGETVEAINRKVLASLNGEYIYQWQYLYNTTKVNVTCVYVNTPGDKKFLFEAAGINYLTSAVAKESGFYITDDIQTAFVVVGDAGYSKIILNFGEYTIKTLDPKYLAAAPGKSKITILPKTTLTVSDPNDPGDGAPITTPFTEYPSAGDTWNVTYNGIEYACELIDASTIPSLELPLPEGAWYFGGNLTAGGFEHVASNNDAPFIIMAAGSEEFAVEMEAYGMIAPIVTLDQTFTVSITKGSQMAPSQLTLRSNGEMVWEERPFYEEKNEVVILPLSNCVADSEEGGDDDGDGLVDTYVIEGSLLNYPAIGAKGTITVNGTEYESEFVDCSPILGDDLPEDYSLIACGNVAVLGLTGGNSDAPLACVLPGNEATAQLMVTAGGVYIFEGELEGQDITISIKMVETKIKKLDSKFVDVEMPYYLPSSVPTENTLILPQTSLEGKFETSAFGRVASNFTDYDFQLKDGHEYTIVCDGAEYKAICSYHPGDMDLSSGWMLSTNGQSNYLTASVDKGIIIWKSETGVSIFGKNSIFTYLEISNIAIKDEAKFVSHLNTKLISDYPSALIQGSDVRSVQHRNARSASSGGFAWGIDCQATGGSAVAWGEQVKAYAANAFARGYATQIHGQNSSSFGSNNIIRGANAFVIGSNHNINSDNVFVAGRSSLDNSNAAYILGNGDSATSVKSNASIVDWSGNGYFAGDLYVNGDGQTIGFDGAKKVATEELVDKKAEGLAAEMVALPKSAGVVDHGTAGQFAVSDGMGGIMWKTLVEAEEVAY